MENIFMSVRCFMMLLIGMACVLNAASLYGQSHTVSGIVSAASGEALPGANILVKGSGRGAAADADGKYALDNLTAADVLVFSFIGYGTKEATVGNNAVLNVSLAPDIASLSEVVVVGYGTQRKIETTGAIASVKSEDIVQTPVTNVAQGLQARVAGVQVNQNSGAPGGNISVRIRGTNSINGTSEPLYVIDGIQVSNSGGITDVSPLSSINPNDIESAEVLKDASATAIYGARGANGVVLITTKRGKSGATRVTLDSYCGIQKVRKILSTLNASQFAQLENEVFRRPLYASPAAEGEGVNWQKLIFREAPIQNHQLSVNGGNDKTQLAASFSYFDQDGVIVNSNFKRYSLRLNLDHRINDRVKIGTSIMGSNNINSGIATGVSSVDVVVTQSVVGAAIGAPPTLKPHQSDGAIFPFADQLDGRYREVANPLGLLSEINKRRINRVLANLYGEVALIKGLTYRASFNIDQQNEFREFYSPISIVAARDRNANSGSASKNILTVAVLLHESILTYFKTINQIHSLKFTGVFATQSNDLTTNNIVASGFPNDVTAHEALQLAAVVSTSSNHTRERLDSYMGRVNYGLKEKYFVDVTARIDGSSKMGANNKYGFFPAVSAAWRVSEENFMKGGGVGFISDLKLRASYGLTGNAGAIEPYRSLALLTTGANYQFNHGMTKGISPGGISNPDLKWERSIQTDIGLDVGLLDDRISFTVDIYRKNTRDLLYDKSLPFTSGYNVITANLGGIENKGIELSANARILDRNFKWSVNANISANRNKVTDIDGGITKERFITTYTILKTGEPLGLFKTYLFDGIYQTGEAIIPGADGRTGGTKVKNVNS
ncbi:MAG: SusC/RagA family TonB-linked outer membrane protein, partial [Candidatus Nephrothrix sp. EaCA]